MRVLVIGAAGSIGTVVCNGLIDRGHEVAGLDLVAEPEGFTGEWFTADCANSAAVAEVFDRLVTTGRAAAVVHLTGIPTEASLPRTLESHVVRPATFSMP